MLIEVSDLRNGIC